MIKKFIVEVDDFRDVVSINEAGSLWRVLGEMINNIQHEIVEAFSITDEETQQRIGDRVEIVLKKYRDQIESFKYTKDGVRVGFPN